MYDFEQFLAVRRMTAPAVSPDGAWVAAAEDTTGQFNLWLHPRAGGAPLQRTSFLDRSVRRIVWAPDGRTLYFAADADGSEFYGIYELAAQGGTPRALADRPGVQYHLSGGAISPDGRLLAYSGNERKPTDVDLFVRDLRRGEARALDLPPAFYAPAGWSPDGRHLLVFDFRQNTDNDILVVPVAGGTPVVPTKHAGTERHSPVAWRGSWIYVVSDRRREFTGLARVKPDGSQWQWVSTPDADVEIADVSRDGRTVLTVVNERGYSRAYVGRRRVRIPDGVVLEASMDERGRVAAFLVATARRPAELYVADLRTGRTSRLTNHVLGGVDEKRLAEPTLVRYPTFDGRRIPAWLYRPRGRRLPVLLSIHGGPTWQERPHYNYMGLYQYLASRGVAVLAPNIRGSTGYGKRYMEMVFRDFGGGDLEDVEHAVAWLRRQPWVDPSRIAIFGGSYGGFITLSAVTRLPDLWCAGVDMVGPANLVTFVQSVPPSWRRFMKSYVGDPQEDRRMLEERSPVRHVDRVRVPMLILQGARDPRVVKAESDQMVEAMRARGVEVEYHVYDDEGHGFTRVGNQRDAYGRIARFLEKTLLPAPVTA